MKIRALAAALALAGAALAAQAMPGAAGLSVYKGEVLETRDVESYTYLRLKTAEGELWAAVPTATVKKGAKVTIGDAMVMTNFESRTLKRKFDRIVFGSLADASGKVPARAGAMGGMGGAAGMGSMGSAHGAAAVSPVPIAKIAKAAGPDGRLVAEVVKGKASLKDRTVLVRAQVVKVNSGIMGKNWVHLQDGSGSAADGTNDILVTTQDKVAVGDVVDARGTVRTDVNLGSGYAYAVLIDNAALKK